MSYLKSSGAFGKRGETRRGNERASGREREEEEEGVVERERGRGSGFKFKMMAFRG